MINKTCLSTKTTKNSSIRKILKYFVEMNRVIETNQDFIKEVNEIIEAANKNSVYKYYYSQDSKIIDMFNFGDVGEFEQMMIIRCNSLNGEQTDFYDWIKTIDISKAKDNERHFISLLKILNNPTSFKYYLMLFYIFSTLYMDLKVKEFDTYEWIISYFKITDNTLNRYAIELENALIYYSIAFNAKELYNADTNSILYQALTSDYVFNAKLGIIDKDKELLEANKIFLEYYMKKEVPNMNKISLFDSFSSSIFKKLNKE